MEDTLNGYPVIKSERIPDRPGKKPARIILVERDERERYITALHCYGDEHWLWGHYFSNKKEAEKDFDDRVKRGY